jgi:Ca2+-binding EF-hand superfamily protein
MLNFMDVDKSGSVDYYKFKVGCAILCQSPPEDTAALLFKMYDHDSDGYMGEEDMMAFVTAAMTNINYFEEIAPPSEEEIRTKV